MRLNTRYVRIRYVNSMPLSRKMQLDTACIILHGFTILPTKIWQEFLYSGVSSERPLIAVCGFFELSGYDLIDQNPTLDFLLIFPIHETFPFCLWQSSYRLILCAGIFY